MMSLGVSFSNDHLGELFDGLIDELLLLNDEVDENLDIVGGV